MRIASALPVYVGVLHLSLCAFAQDDQTLIAQAAAERDQAPLVAVEDVRPADNFDAEEREARLGAALAQARLELVLARKALRNDEHKDAAAHALRVQDALHGFSTDAEAEAYDLQAEGVIARAKKAGVDVAGLCAGVQPGDRVDAWRPQREPALRKAYMADEVRLLLDADEARVAPVAEVVYPDDWARKAAKREKFFGGQIARSDSWIDEDGREWYAALYDIHDLIYVPPDFSPAATLDLNENYRNAMDRHALLWGGGLFNSFYPRDPWRAVSLLRHFGGVDDFAFRGPKYSAERQRQIVEMIGAFTTHDNDARIIVLDPTP